MDGILAMIECLVFGWFPYQEDGKLFEIGGSEWVRVVRSRPASEQGYEVQFGDELRPRAWWITFEPATIEEWRAEQERLETHVASGAKVSEPWYRRLFK